MGAGMGDLLYSELSGRIRQAAFEVHQYFGSGFLEKVYENSLAYKLKKQEIQYYQQLPVKVVFEDDVIVGEYYADLLVEDRIIIELKAVTTLTRIHRAQVKNYLKATRYRLGLLINFGGFKLEFKRIIL
jgi:GxxExxY protein